MTHYRPWQPLLAPEHLVRGPAMIIAPHPDDEVIGCGGAILAHRDAGEDVVVVLVTDGMLGNPDGPSGDEYTSKRKRETEEALNSMGGGRVVFLDFPDGGLREAGDRPRAALKELIERERPATLFNISPFEIHPDHRACSLATFAALEGLDFAPRLLCYEVGASLPANLLINVTAIMPRKEAGILAFLSQLEHQDLIEKVRAVNRANTVNVADPLVHYAEAYLEVDPAQAQDFLAEVEAMLARSDAMGPA